MKAVVTGGKGGIGRAVVAELSKTMEVEIIDLPEVDVRHYGMLTSYFYRRQHLDVLVNCAGIGTVKPFLDCSHDEWFAQIETNLLGTMNCCHAAIPYMHGGDIINISSRSARYDHKGLAAYCASKAGVSMFSDCLAAELQEFDIRVSHILPGRVNTGFAGDPLREWHIKPENIAATVSAILRMDRNASIGRMEIIPSRSK